MNEHTRKIIDSYKWDTSKIIQQLESCNYECEAGCLNKNVAFTALKEMADRDIINDISMLWECIRRLVNTEKSTFEVPIAMEIVESYGLKINEDLYLYTEDE